MKKELTEFEKHVASELKLHVQKNEFIDLAHTIMGMHHFEDGIKNQIAAMLDFGENYHRIISKEEKAGDTSTHINREPSINNAIEAMEEYRQASQPLIDAEEKELELTAWKNQALFWKTLYEEVIEASHNELLFFAQYLNLCFIEEGSMTYPSLIDAITVWEGLKQGLTKLPILNAPPVTKEQAPQQSDGAKTNFTNSK